MLLLSFGSRAYLRNYGLHIVYSLSARLQAESIVSERNTKLQLREPE